MPRCLAGTPFCTPVGGHGKMAGNIPRMTPELVKQLCKERGLWTVPHLNSQLFLNFKGFEAIEGLEEYVNTRALYLDNNSIKEIDGIDRMTDLRTLHLSGNRITRIQNLSFNLKLRQLTLESNAIRRTEGLQHLVELEVLNLSGNSIARLEDMQELQALPSLVNVDVSKNQLEDTEGVVEFWSEMPQLKVLRYNGNPGVRDISNYRKRLVNAVGSLTYLDERPIFPVERRACAAWAEGGTESMHKAKVDFHRERQAEYKLDPERAAFLTERRQREIARIDREKQEREEREAKELEERCKRGAAISDKKLHDGDEGALKDYMHKWRTKKDLYGVEGLSAKCAKDASGAAALPQPRDAFSFAPAARPAGDTHAFGHEPKTEAPSAAAGASAMASRAAAAPPPRRARPALGESGAAFRADAGGAADSIEDRQLLVLGDDPWQSHCGAPGSERDAPQAKAGEDDIIPELWRGREKATQEEEKMVMDRNFAIAKRMQEDTRAPAPSRGNELNDLD